MENVTDRLTLSLLDDWQRDFPIVSRPFDVIGQSLGLSGAEVITRLDAQCRLGRVTRVGATCAPNTVSASTLAALAAPEDRIEEIAAIIGAEEGVNHSYLREDEWNMWFVATGPDRAHVDATLGRIEHRSGLRVLDLRLVRPFNVDLGFAMKQSGSTISRSTPVDLSVCEQGDRTILQILTKGLPLTSQPFLTIAESLGRTEDDVMIRIRALIEAGIVSRCGVIVRHRALGWRSNAMVVWDLTPSEIDEVGPLLAAQKGVTLCYERQPVEGIWPYRLYTMIHARSRAEALGILERIAQLPQLQSVPHKALFSVRCFKQTGALIKVRSEEAA
ncbi:MAG: Lrp/AsnC family transcriptional regulator [Stappiaceae bacterium]